MTTRTSAPLLWLALAASVAGCGDVTFPWSSAGPMLSVSASRLDYEAEQGGSLPEARRLTVTFRGAVADGGFVGSVPSWATAEAVSEGGGSVTISVAVTTTALSPGNYDATLRFVSAQADGSDLTTRDVAIRYHVARPLAASLPALTLATMEGYAPVPAELTLSAERFPASWTLAVEGAGAGPTDWLILPVASGTLSGASGTVRIEAAPRPMGTYGAVLVLRDGAGVERGRIPVTYAVEGLYAVTGETGARVTEGAARADLERPLTLETRLDVAAGQACGWEIASDAPWLTVTPSSGNLTADTPLTVHLDAEQLWSMSNGHHSAALTVTFPSGCASSSSSPFTVDLALQPALTAAAPAGFVVRRDSTVAALARTVSVGSNLGEAFAAHGGWTASASMGWVAATPQDASMSLELQPGPLGALANGIHAATVTVRPDDARVAGETFDVALDLALPAVTRVAPYTTWVNRESSLVVRGVGFGAGGTTLPVSMGGTERQASVVSDTELRVTAPAQSSAGRVEVAVPNALQLARPTATLAVLPEPGYGAHTASLAGQFSKLALDPERQAVLLTGYPTQEVRRLRWVDGAWTEDAAPLAHATGVAITADGADLLATAGWTSDGPVVVRLDPDTLEQRQASTFYGYYTTYDLVAPFNDGRTLIVNSEQWASSVWYPSLSVGPRPLAHNPTLLLTRDRSRAVLPSDYEDFSFDAGDTAFRTRTFSTSGYEWQQGISGDGDRLVVGKGVYDREFRLLGSLDFPYEEWWALAVTPDGAAAYTLGHATSGTSWVLRRADLRPDAGPYPAVATAVVVPLAVSEYPRAMAVSEDGSTIFVVAMSGSGSKFLAVPLP